jgi:hypothetical protein
MHVITCLGGGLGNQLFQYAAGRSLATRTGSRLILDDSRIRAPGGFGYVFGNLAIEEVLVFGRHCGPEAECYRTMPEEQLGHPFLRERSFDYDARFEAATAPAILFGFWQSERYFRSIAGSLRTEYQVKAPPEGANARWLDEIRRAESVCVHVRRTDTVTTISAKTHGTCSIAYYERGMNYFRRTVRHPRFFVFSDDWEWSREHFSAPDTEVVDANGPGAADQELRLMSSCRHHIIANSSLSWWGAWLGESPSQTVIAPEPWFVTGRPTPDLLPGRWRRMPR